MNSKNQGAHRGGFTLVEIVIVLVIIGILTALIFPAFSAARKRAQDASCLSNLHQIGVATRLYVDDYDGRYPYGINPLTREMDLDLFIPKELISQLPNSTALIQPYLKSPEILHCPRDSGGDFAFGKINSNFERWNTSYSYNEFLVFYFPRSEMERVDPTKLDLFRDAGFWHDNEETDTLETNRFVQVIYADLHVKKTKIYDLGVWAEQLEIE